MKFPNHVILDWNTSSSSTSSQYWILKYFKNSHVIDSNFKSSSFFLKNPINQKNKKTVIFSNNFFFKKYATKDLAIFKKFFQKNINFKKIKQTDYLNSFLKNQHEGNVLRKSDLALLFKNFSYTRSDEKHAFKANSIWRMFDINFLRKEKIYTKLKYSRVPQYDIVSGGAAALFAGFLGFLICEKFGFELLDSGDFYIFVMYVVFFSFFARIYLKIFSSDLDNWNIISLKWFFSFYQTITLSFFMAINKKFNK